MASITDQNWVVWNQGKNPLVNFNFMLRVEMAYDLPCKSVRAFSRELEYDYIQEGGLNDYVHMRRKPISKPFTLEVERYVGVDYVDPLPLGADLALPVLLFVSRNHDQFIPGVVARTYMFTGCTVMKKTYGDLIADQPGLLVETTTLGYREMLCVDIPWSEVGDDIPGSTESPTRNVSGEDKRGTDLKILAMDLYDKAKAERDQAAKVYDPAAVTNLIGELQAMASALSAASKVPGGPLEAALTAAEEANQSAQQAADNALQDVQEKEAAAKEVELAWQTKRAEWNALQNEAESATREEAAVKRTAAQAEDTLKKKRAALVNARAAKKDAEAALEKAKADAEKESGKLTALQKASETTGGAIQEANQALTAASGQKAEADTSEAEASEAAKQAALEAGNLEKEEARLRDAAETAREAAEEARSRMNEIAASESPEEAGLEERRRALAEAEKNAEDARRAWKEAQQRTKEAQRQAKEADTRAKEARNTAGEARDRERSAQRKLEDAQRQTEAAQQRVTDAQKQVDRAQERVENAQLKVEECEKRIGEAQKDVEDAEKDAEQAKQAVTEPRRQAEAAKEKAAKAKNEDAKAEQAVKSARGAVAAASERNSAARDAASAAAAKEVEARSTLDQTARQANAIQNSLINLTDRSVKSPGAMAACEGALLLCKEANITTQGLPDEDLELVNASYEQVKKRHKDTVYHARLVREIQQYMDVGEKQLNSARALQEKING